MTARALRTRGLRLAVVLLCGSAACSDARQAPLSPLAQQGQRVYTNVCIACHNGDPWKDGAAGPAIAGSPRELVEARVLRAEYPPGYTPKRPGNAMPRFEYLADQIDALTAYLAEAPRSPSDGAAPTG